MKVILLAGGFGTRLSEYTESIPKPMVPIGEKPILWHIMNLFAHYGYKDFYIALGYKAELIKEYFHNYHSLHSDFSVDLKTGFVKTIFPTTIDWNINLIYTGLDSLTGGRVKRLETFIGNETFLLTYGDGVSDINISSLIEFHKSHKKMVTVTAVHPSARFGELEIVNGVVTRFQEKPQTKQGWINGGFFVIEPEFFHYLKGDDSILEKEPLETVAKMGELMAYQHEGFWQCMDTKRDKDYLEELWRSGSAPWKL